MSRFPLFPLVFAASVSLAMNVGCQPQVEPLERTTQQIIDKVIAPAVEKAVAETSMRTATIQGGLQGVEPGWVAEVDGYLVNGFKGAFRIYAKGVAGQIVGHTQADQGQPASVPPPAIRPTATAPAAG